MLKFLYGWRRKLGVIALLLACVLGVLWVRSLLALDVVGFDLGT